MLKLSTSTLQRSVFSIATRLRSRTRSPTPWSRHSKGCQLRDAARSHRTANVEAYNEYLLGCNSTIATPKTVFAAIAAYRKAIALDPRYRAAYAGVGMSETLLAESTHDAADIKHAITDAQNAVELAPNLADSYATRGLLR